MQWNKGFTASYYAAYVDAYTWRDVEKFDITDGSITKDSEGLLESADLTAYDFDQTRERWVRIYLDAAQGGDKAHEPLFTGLATSPERNIQGNLQLRKVSLFSVLKPCEDILLERGWFAPLGSDGAELIRELLEATPAPVTQQGRSPKLSQSIVAEDGETALSMIEKILAAINWRLIINGDGTIVITSKSKEPSQTFDQDTMDIIEPEVTIKRDWFECPNVFRAVEGDNTYTAEDINGSNMSIEARGRRVMMEELNAVTNDNESLQDYAERRLREEQQLEESASYKRRYMPDLHVGDMIRMHYKQIDGIYIINEQKINLDYGATVDEEVITYAEDR